MRSGRVEVLTGPERRRKWSDETKIVIVAEALADDVVISVSSDHFHSTSNRRAPTGVVTSLGRHYEIIPHADHQRTSGRPRNVGSSQLLRKGEL